MPNNFYTHVSILQCVPIRVIVNVPPTAFGQFNEVLQPELNYSQLHSHNVTSFFEDDNFHLFRLSKTDIFHFIYLPQSRSTICFEHFKKYFQILFIFISLNISLLYVSSKNGPLEFAL